LYEKERTLRRVLLAHDTMTEARENCRGKFHLQQRLEITQQYQEEERRKEYRREHP
jgi:hypothetical protein